MNSTRKNHNLFSCQDAPTPHHEVEMFALKSVLLYWLKHFLANEYERDEVNFTDFSYDRNRELYPETPAETRQDSPTPLISLKKSRENDKILYTTALPQILRHGLNQRSELDTTQQSTKEITYDLTNLLVKFQLKCAGENPICDDNKSSTLANFWEAFQIESERAGWIAFRLSNRGVSIWINQLQAISQMAEENHTLVIKNLPLKLAKKELTLRAICKNQRRYAKAQAERSLWQTQHAHARACSLMTQWQSAVKKYPQLRQLSPLSLPAQPIYTQQLIHALIETADTMFCAPIESEQLESRQQQRKWQRLRYLGCAKQVSQSFDQFCRLCARSPIVFNSRIPKTADLSEMPDLLTELSVYLCLVNGTRNLLKLLLQTYLRVPAPTQM